MAGRSGSSFQKRQKEMARVEKQREKFARRLAKKHSPNTGETEEPVEHEHAEQPETVHSLAESVF
ncbi:MAG TPA: hypothetical protein VFT60_12375 [Bryobacteraceae bacterium]|nr:hypothetical protein [Bryobacteraceae bacterium]